MTNIWIHRNISNILSKNTDAIQILRGPRQVGKSSLFLKINPDFTELSLDDQSLRRLAQVDPELFLKNFSGKKIFIDEIQYAPELFSALKRKVDLYKRDLKNPLQTLVRLTGSNQILMDKYIKESLAGRASFFELNTLSVSEILNSKALPIQEILYRGGWPELYARDEMNTKKYLDDYINSYIEKDIVLSAGIQKSNEFLKFIQLLAGRVGEILDLSSFSREVGVDSKTIKDWTFVLVKMGIIYLLPPYSGNLNSRLVKSPKIYFIDTGLACRLQGWSSAEPIATSPQQGHLFENLVFSEIYKTSLNFNLNFKIYHWRSREGEEIDFLIQIDPRNYIFIEAKVSIQKLKNIQAFPEVKKVFKANTPEIFLCHQEGDHILNKSIPISFLAQFLKLKSNSLEPSSKAQFKKA